MAEHRPDQTCAALPRPAGPTDPAGPAAPADASVRPAAAPPVRPLVRPVGHLQPRRPARTVHPGRRALSPHGPATARPEDGGAVRRARHPKGLCGPSGGAGQGDLAGRFAHRLVEVLTGARPVGQLQRHTTLAGYQQLTALVRTGPLRPRGSVPRTRLGRVYDSAPAPDALEVCVRVEFGPRHHMVAFRLERHRRTEQWQCAAVEAR